MASCPLPTGVVVKVPVPPTVLDHWRTERPVVTWTVADTVGMQTAVGSTSGRQGH